MTTIRALTLLIVFFLISGSAYAKYITGEEIRSIFEGKTYHWTHTKRADSGKTYLNPDGNVHGMKNGKERGGSWEVQGNQLCFTGKKVICRSIEPVGNDKYYLVKDGNKRVIEITRIEEGDTI